MMRRRFMVAPHSRLLWMRPSSLHQPSAATSVLPQLASAARSAAAVSCMTDAAALCMQRALFCSTTQPLRQGISVVKQSLDPESALLARAGYTLFVLAHVGDNALALYCPTTSKLLMLQPSEVSAAVAFMDVCTAAAASDKHRAATGGSIIFPEDNTPICTQFCQAVKRAVTSHTVVLGPDSWSVVFESFRAQREHVKALHVPDGFEHASYLMSNNRFTPLNIPQGYLPDPKAGGVIATTISPSDVDGDVHTVARRALVVWDALFGVHKRFGVVGSKKLLNPVDAVVRRAVKAVNIFGVDLDNRLGRGSVVEGITMVATIYNAQTGTNTVHQIRNLSDETVKLNALTTLLYSEGTSSMTVLIPSPRTKEQQLLMFARICKPKCPFFVVHAKELAPIFNVPESSFNFTETNDPKALFQKTISACVPGLLKKDEGEQGQRIVRAITHLGQRLYDKRIGNALNAFKTSGVTQVPIPKSSDVDFTGMQQRFAATSASATAATTTVSGGVATTPAASDGNATAAGSSPPAPARPVYLNQVTRDASVAIGLQQWTSTIYQNPDRLKREEAAQQSITRFLVVDLETTTKKRYKRIANPFTRENHVVLSGAMDHKGTIFLPDAYFSKEVSQAYDDPAVCKKTVNVKGSSPRSLFLPPLDDYDVLVGHNFKFDLLHIWRDAELKAFLKRGGKIWDTMYGEYLLTGHQVKLGRGAGLEDVARSYGGQIPKLDEVKQAWAMGKQTYDIPYATLKEYLIGDLKNTALIFNKHRERALVQRQVIICNARMDSLLATTEMEYNGLKTDVPLAIRQSNELVGKAVRLRQDLDSYIPEQIPAKLRKYYNWASNQMLIPYFFGGKVKLNTANRECKAVTGEKTPRHLAFSTPDDYPISAYPDGVFMASVQNAAGAGDCVVVTCSGEAEKGTRVFTTCIEAYMKQCGFRKSSTIADSVSKELLPVSRTTGAVAGAPDAIANLLPDRVVFLYAAMETNRATGALSSLVFLHADTHQATTIDCVITPTNTAASIAQRVESHLRDVASSSTVALLPADDMIDPSMTPDAFATAQVIVIARDAPFSFRRALDAHSPELQAVLARRTAGDSGAATTTPASDQQTAGGDAPATTTVVPTAGNAVSLNLADRFALTFADATSTMLYYYFQHSSDAANAYDSKSKTYTTTSPDWIMQPEWMPAPKGKTRPPMLPFLVEQEANEAPLRWCQRYCAMFRHIAAKSFEHDAAKPLEEKKARKNSPPPKADEVLPLLLRRRPAIRAEVNAMDATRKARLTLMMLFGRLTGTSHDAIVEPSAFSDTVEVPLKGKLVQYFKTDSSREMDAITAKFRSPVTRQLQVGDDSLTYFAKTHKDPAAVTIMELRGMEKLIGTYYEHTEGGTGMVSLTHSIDSCIHHELVHNKTNTGRLASSNPNCQNIPKEDKSPLREMFVSRFAPHGKCIEVDYSQLEVITLAALSNDRQMIEDLRNNIDFHCKRVTMIRPDLSYDEVVLRAKKNKEPEFVKLRQQAKIFSFQRQYGAGVTMLSESTGLAPDQVRLLIEGEKVLYQGCDQFTNMVTLSANNYDASLQDGNRNIRGHQVYKGMFPVITGSRYVFTESDMPEAMLRDKPASVKSTNFSPTHIKNYPVQGFAGEIVQIMLGRLWRHFVECNHYDGKALLTNTVHDCVWVDAREEVYLQVSKDVERILSSAREALDELFPEMKCGVSFGVDVVAGENMCHLRPLPKEAKK